MSFTITFYGPRHYFWKHRWSAWFARPDDRSTGGIGFKIPGLHMAFHWGKRRV